MEVLSRYLSEGAEETTENLNQDSRCPALDSNGAPPGYRYRTAPLHQPALCSVSTTRNLHHSILMYKMRNNAQFPIHDHNSTSQKTVCLHEREWFIYVTTHNEICIQLMNFVIMRHEKKM
jgi:hypothetical protein